MPEYSHRDHRAHREVDRALWTVVGLSGGLVGLAMAVPVPFVGIVAVVGLAVLGLAYLGWSDRMLGQYASDLRHTQEPSTAHGFARAEASSRVQLDRDAERYRSASPHVRRRPRADRSEERDVPLPSGSDSDHA